MTDSEIKRLLEEYVEAEMSQIDREEFEEKEFMCSPKYEKRIKKLFSFEKYFGKNIYFGYVMQKVAIIAVCILGFVGVNEVSANVFGVNPWNYTVSYLFGTGMEQKRYGTKSNSFEGQEVMTPIRDVPEYVPKGLIQEKIDDSNPKTLYVDWISRDQKKAVQYMRIKLNADLTITSDGEYTEKEECEIGGFVAYYYVKRDENWISWEDSEYRYEIYIVGINNPKGELMKIANSIYQ